MKTTISAMLISLTLLGTSIAYAAEAPASDARPLAVCKDGKTMYSTTGSHQGACRGHGGVAEWKDGSPVKAHKGSTRSYR
jgi:hypothetical protein